MTRRITDNVERGKAVSITIDGRAVTAYTGETLAAVLLTEGITAFHRSRSGRPRGPWCNMGTCFECQVQVAPDGRDEMRWWRACMYPVADGLTVITGAKLSGSGTADEE